MKRLLFPVVLAFLAVGCSGFTQKNLGDLGEACFGDGTCNGALVCVDKVCVEATGDEDTVNTDTADSSDVSDTTDSPDDDTTDTQPDATDSSDTVADEDVVTDEDTVIPDEDELTPDEETDTVIPDVDVYGDMVKIPNGNFMMGCNTAVDTECVGDGGEAPYHDVYLDTYWIDIYEVTNEKYQDCVDATACVAPHYDDGTCYIYNGTSWVQGAVQAVFRGAQKPVVCVNWAEAKTYCEWAGKRLPTEAEWEKAARDGDGRKYPWGNTAPTSNHAVYSVSNTYDVGSKEAGKSPYGAYDMAGNVWEWVNDWYATDYYASSPSVNPEGPATGTSRVLRGGSWNNNATNLRASNRNNNTPGNTNTNNGFRCANVLPVRVTRDAAAPRSAASDAGEITPVVPGPAFRRGRKGGAGGSPVGRPRAIRPPFFRDA